MVRSSKKKPTRKPVRRRGLQKKAKSPQKKRYWKILILAGALLLVVLAGIDFVVIHKFEGKKWALPARVFARPLELYVGLPVKHEQLDYELKGLGYRFTSRLQQPGDVVKKGEHYQIYTRAFRFWDKPEPARQIFLTIKNTAVTQLTDHKYESLSVVRLDPQQIGGIYPSHMEDRLLVKLQDIPPLLGETLIAVEDKGFLDHFGVSPKAIARAAWANFRAVRIVQGGSTLTQQLVKNFYLNHSRSLSRKLLEAVMSVLLELHYSKSEILETYLNEVYLGQSGPRAIHGFALGSQHYFSRPLDKLNVQEIALLVGLVKGASYYNPWRYPDRAMERRNLVLKIMAQDGLITPQQRSIASSKPLGIVKVTKRRLHDFPSFIDLVKRQLKEDYAEADLRSEGLQVFTTLSPSVQHSAETALHGRLNQLEKSYAMPKSTLQGAVIVTSVGSGEVLATVGGRDPKFAGFNRVLYAKRPIGSLIKPAVYLAALERSDEYTLATLLNDSAVNVGGQDGSLWQPQNFSKQSHGDVLLNDALSYSYNQATARLGMNLGLGAVIETVKKLGVKKEFPIVPSVLLGAVDLSPFDVAGMYHTIAAEGVHTPLRAIRAVMTANNEPLRRYPLQTEQQFSNESIHLLQYALQSVMRKGTGKNAYSQLPENISLAGKTGTTNDQRDSWFAGFGGNHLSVVWVGRDDNGKTPLTGASGALRVWADTYSQLSLRPLLFEKPRVVSYYWIDEQTGKLSGENCRGAELMPFVEGTQPVETVRCEWLENPVLRWFRKIW